MTQQSIPPRSTVRLVDQVSSIRQTLAHQQVPIADMSRAGSLELRQSSMQPVDNGPRGSIVPLRIDRLEGPIRSREIEGGATPVSNFRYFLDGSQKTIPVCRVGLTPVVVGLSAAGILYREIGSQPSLLGESLNVRQSWIVPRGVDDSNLGEMIREIESAGGQIVDPLVNDRGDPHPDRDRMIGDYARLLSRSYDVAGKVRGKIEQDVLHAWAATVSPRDPDHWIVVDGPLMSNVPRAVGVVKELLTQHLGGNEAVALFDMPQGHRTTAFRYVSTFRDTDDDGAPTPSSGRTMWYMRLWNAVGMDARHSLIRVETAHDVDTTEQIDEISRWILAERLPRPTDDPRWPTLLYPIHYLERILKRRLAEITTGWPSA